MAAQSECERCGEAGANVYTFHYGRETAAAEYGAPVYQPGVGTTRTETHHYEVAGSQQVPLCGSCVMKQRLLGVAAEIGNTPIMWLGVLAAVILPPALVVQGNIAAAAGIVAATVAVLFLIFTFATPERRVAEELAIKMRKDSLSASQFWTTEEYEKLRPEDAGRFGPLAR
jgi:hypothetical protein